jgi:hypothetical protein
MSRTLGAQAFVGVLLLAAGAAQAATPLFQDDFQRRRGWPVTDPSRPAEGGLFTYLSDGSYQITPLRTGGWAIATPPGTYGADVRAGVDVFLAGANPASVVGLACRIQDSRNFYGLVIGIAQGWGIFRMVDGTVTSLDKGALSIDAIRSQRVEAECSGRRLALTVNGRRLSEVQDSTFGRGQVGLLVAASRSASVSGAFDNFALYAAGAGDIEEAPRERGLDVERRTVARTELPAPVGGPALRPNEALVTIAYQTFRYEAVIAWKGEARTISGQVSSPLGRHDALVSPGGNGYTVVLRSGPSYSSGIAAWSIDVDTFTGRARCTRSPLYDGALGRMSVINARGQTVCEL